MLDVVGYQATTYLNCCHVYIIPLYIMTYGNLEFLKYRPTDSYVTSNDYFKTGTYWNYEKVYTIVNKVLKCLTHCIHISRLSRWVLLP